MKFELIHPSAVLPTRGTEGSAGVDLYATETVRIPPGETRLVPLGIKCEMPRQYVAIFKDRSGLGFKGITVLAGVIDSDYRGEWKVILLNTRRYSFISNRDFVIKKGERPAQAVFLPYWNGSPMEGFVSCSTRGSGGFGSTGK